MQSFDNLKLSGLRYRYEKFLLPAYQKALHLKEN